MKTPIGTEVDLGPRHIVLDGTQLPPPRKRHSSLPLFGSCLLWPRSPISATAELLFLKTIAVYNDKIAYLNLVIKQQIYVNKNSSGDEIANVNF